jgi:hypothetical protein
MFLFFSVFVFVLVYSRLISYVVFAVAYSLNPIRVIT